MLRRYISFNINMSLKLTIFSSLLVITSAAQLCSKRSSHNLGVPYKINRVIGGTDAAQREFPHQVSLQLGNLPYTPLKHICGGTIINEEWILTAAHCVNKLLRSSQLVVKAGKHHINSQEPTEQAAYVAKVIIHKEYRGEVSPNDIALLKLTTPLKFNNFVSAINLPAANVIPKGHAFLSGWGSISRTVVPILPRTLQKATLPLIENSVCKRAMRILGEKGEIHDTNLCTGPLTGGLSACSGDSGGPLISTNEKGTKELVGIVSWGQVPCGGYGSPTVFVRVSAFIGWINDVLNNYNN